MPGSLQSETLLINLKGFLPLIGRGESTTRASALRVARLPYLWSERENARQFSRLFLPMLSEAKKMNVVARVPCVDLLVSASRRARSTTWS